MTWAMPRNLQLMEERKNYRFRVYYLTKDTIAIRSIKEKFKTTVSVNGESWIETDEHGAGLVKELEKRGFVKIRHYEEFFKS